MTGGQDNFSGGMDRGGLPPPPAPLSSSFADTRTAAARRRPRQRHGGAHRLAAAVRVSAKRLDGGSGGAGAPLVRTAEKEFSIDVWVYSINQFSSYYCAVKKFFVK